MTDEVKDALPAEEKPAGTEKENSEIKKPIGEIFEKKEARVVPEAVLIQYKKDNKDLSRKLEEAQKALESGASKVEIASSIQELAEKHDVSPEFLQGLMALTKSEAEKEITAKMESEMRPLKEKEAREKFEKSFNEHIDKALDALSEYKGVADKDLIKTLAQTPQYSEMSFEQIFEKLYPNVQKNKRTLDEANPTRGGTKPTLDVNRAKNDPEYFNEIMADPQLKKEYNEGLKNRIRL